MMFAIITPALITGAFTNRVRFPAYLIFLVLWLLLVYFPFVHMVWGGGFLASTGACWTSPAASWCTTSPAWRPWPRCSSWAGGAWPTACPHSIPLVALGTGLLWFGWYGFNAGSELQVDHITALAFLNTDVAASFAAITWLIIEWSRSRKPRFVGLLTGAVAGLATITPAAGYVTLTSAALIGIIAGAVCYLAVELKNACAGTMPSTSGACTAWAARWASSCSACSAASPSIRRAPTAS